MEVEIERVEPGDGATFPAPGDTVRAYYRGTLVAGGREFHAVQPPAEPFEFVHGARDLIPGWTQALGQLSAGEKAVFTVPAALGYAERGYPDPSLPGGFAIPPNSDLRYEVTVAAVLPQPTAEEKAAAAKARLESFMVDLPQAPGQGSSKKGKKKGKKGKKRR